MQSLVTCATVFFCSSNTNRRGHRHLKVKHEVTTERDRTIKVARDTQPNDNVVSTRAFFRSFLPLHVREGLMDEARMLFDKMPERTLVDYTILMSGYVRYGPVEEVFVILRKMVGESNYSELCPDSFVFAVLIRACTIITDIDYGQQLHCRMLRTGVMIDSYIENALITMYATCGRLRLSSSIFDQILQPDLVSWSSLMRGYVKNGFGEIALKMFCEMRLDGIQPDAFAYSTIIGTCANLRKLYVGTQLHSCIIKEGFGSCLFLQDTLIDFYARCGELDGSRKIFDAMELRDLVSFNTIISGYVSNLQNHDAVKLFRHLLTERPRSDDFTLASVLVAITNLGALNYGREIHGYMIRNGFSSNEYIISALLDMYSKCGNVREIPLKLFSQMNCKFDKFIVAGMLESCASFENLKMGTMLHSCIEKLGLKLDPYIVSSLIDMYSKCGNMEAARTIFDRIKSPGTVAWSATISGYCLNGQYVEALRLFAKMQFYPTHPNEFTYTSIIQACANLGDISKGKEIHSNILKNGYESMLPVIKSLINFYASCGNLNEALKLSYSLQDDEISWRFLIQACKRNQNTDMMLEVFHHIQQHHGKIDRSLACCILNSCANSVLLNSGTQAQAYFIKRGLISDPEMNIYFINMYSAV